MKTIIEPLRERQPEDTIKKCVQTRQFMPGVIKARDEFDDIDLVFPWRTAFQMKRDEHTFMKPWYIKYKDEEIRVNLHQLDYYFKTNEPYFMHFQRYIVGRPNLLRLPLYAV